MCGGQHAADELSQLESEQRELLDELDARIQEKSAAFNQADQEAKKAIAGFKIRQGYPIGTMVTLRGERMFEFLDRLVTVALPRVRDFRGVSAKAFDGRGNYNIGVKEQIIFPEISIDKVTRISGMDITFVTSASTDDEAFHLLKEFGIPFKTN